MARESLGTESGKSWGGGEEKFVWIPESKLSMHNDVVSWSELPLHQENTLSYSKSDNSSTSRKQIPWSAER